MIMIQKFCCDMQTAEEAMTPIESTFSLDVNSKLDWWVCVENGLPFMHLLLCLIYCKITVVVTETLIFIFPLFGWQISFWELGFDYNWEQTK